MDLYPKLSMIVTAMQGRVGSYPALRYSVFHTLHQTAQDTDALTPLPPKSVIEEDRNRRVAGALTDLAGFLKYNPHYSPTSIFERLKAIGEWISEYVLPGQSLCCCQGRLPQTVEIMTDQHEIPWELTWVEGNFLSSHVVHARYPFVSKARHHSLIYESPPKFAVVIGRSEGLFSAQDELDEIQRMYSERFKRDITIFQGEAVRADFLRRLLADGATVGGPFDVIHFIGHGDSQTDQVWLELTGSPFLDSYVPPSMNGNPLIFWNACFSASSTAARYRYQADIVDAFGGKLLSSGASHFIGPLFPVLDTTAHRLAVSFYSHLFSGLPVGLAFFNAKKELGAIDPIAQSYVLYGNPAVRVVTDV